MSLNKPMPFESFRAEIDRLGLVLDGEAAALLDTAGEIAAELETMRPAIMAGRERRHALEHAFTRPPRASGRSREEQLAHEELGQEMQAARDALVPLESAFAGRVRELRGLQERIAALVNTAARA